ncbi:MAG: hypothetical protein JF612_14845 [Planctomycetia bacterium]|jgi:hypothetical protein|nr:hypothetical protein [Planctomycetia bacterium]
MKSKSDFWLTLQELIHDLEREGDHPDEQAKSVCELLESLPPVTKDVYLSNLSSVAEILGKVLARCWD